MRLTKKEVIRELYRNPDPNIRFVANVILCHHSNPYKKLLGLYALLNKGHYLKCADFNLDVLTLDGYTIEWKKLEEKY
jgi:hypothetical protein